MLGRVIRHFTRPLHPPTPALVAVVPKVEPQVALLPDALGKPDALKIAVLGTCIAESLATAAKGGCVVDHYLMQSRAEDEPPDIDWSAYDAVVVHLTLRQVMWQAADDGRDVLHTRTQSDENYASSLATVTEHTFDLIRKINSAVGMAVPVFFLAFAEPPATYQGVLLNNRRKSLYHFVHTLNDRMSEFLEESPGAHYIEINDLIRYMGDAVVSDAYVNHFTHAGFLGSSDAIFDSIMTRTSHAMTILRSESPVKLIITDLDNTLWKGVLAEMDDIVPHEHTEGWPLGYVESLLEFKRRGGLLAISSKNDHDATLERFAKVWRGRLSIDDFCSVKINWDPKSKNIQEILSETNLLPTNALFIDDNPREIEEVTRVFPALRTLSGEQSAWRNVILYSPHTQVARISDESAARTELILAKRKRDELADKMDRGTYLRSLGIRVHVDSIDDSSHPKYARAAELVNKTNQFNTTGKRWSTAEFDSLLSGSGAGRIVAMSASDKFGDNGLVAVAIVRGNVIEQVVMSCRVFGLGIETALLERVLRSIAIENGDAARAKFVTTGKNKTCASFYRDHGFTEDEGQWHAGAFPACPDWIIEP
jgi:FkbH-like protein